MSEKMSAERAAEILDPERAERFTSMEPITEACLMGRDALRLKTPRNPFPCGLTCPNCGSGEYLYNAYELHNKVCGNCGQAIDWSEVEDV